MWARGVVLAEFESVTGMPYTAAGQMEIDEAVTEPKKEGERLLSWGMHAWMNRVPLIFPPTQSERPNVTDITEGLKELVQLDINSMVIIITLDSREFEIWHMLF